MFSCQNSNSTEDDVREYFERFGRLEDCVVMKFPDSGRSRGFGFITFEKAYMVDDCQKSRPHELGGKAIECKRATPKQDAKKPEAQASVKKIFIGGLNDEVTDADLETYFGSYGRVLNVEQMKWNDTGKKRGFGFVEFDDFDPVDKICLVGRHSVMGRRLEVKKALSKQEMLIAKKSRMDDGGYGNMGRGGGMGGGGAGMGMNQMGGM